MNYLILIPLGISWIVSICILIYMKNKTIPKDHDEIYNIERAALNYAQECLIVSLVIAIAPSATTWIILTILDKNPLISIAIYIAAILFVFRITVKFKYGNDSFGG